MKQPPAATATEASTDAAAVAAGVRAVVLGGPGVLDVGSLGGGQAADALARAQAAIAAAEVAALMQKTAEQAATEAGSALAEKHAA